MSTAKRTSKKAAPRRSGSVPPKPTATKASAISDVRLFFSRDESWLKFNERVLEEAEDAGNPLMERVKFLAITASNLDEFLEIRVAGILQQIEDGFNEPQRADEGGLTPTQQMDRLKDLLHKFTEAQANCWNQRLLPELAKQGIRVLKWSDLDTGARNYALEFFQKEVDPLLTPVTVDPSHPFPRVLNKALCIALLLQHKRRTKAGMKAPRSLGVVTVPRSLPRLVQLPSANGNLDFLLLHELIGAQVGKMFRGYEVLAQSAFRVTRNSNLYMQEEESRSVLESVRTELHNRRKGDAVRLEIDSAAPEEICERLRINFELDEWQVFRTDAPVNLYRLMNLYSEVKKPAMKYPDFKAREYKLQNKSANVFEDIRKRDILLHHPFDSYKTVEGFIESGSEDPSVISMKQTLYRTSADSPIFRALIEAATSKDVTVVVELMARFDEASNIRWARELEDAGVQVFHGIYGLKTHCKLSLLVRRDPDGVIRRYAHLGTGNYNPVTARFYTDISLLTANPAITAGVQAVFNYLTAGSESDSYRPLMMAPLSMSTDLVKLIDRETAHARSGRKTRIVAKMNGLLDRRTIEALYCASQAGVEIDLIVRGMCSLRPGVKGLSENICVRSVVGRFLEHSRIFYFGNGGETEIYCGSADWMPRNLYERCEVLFPVWDEVARQRLKDEILTAYLADNTKARLLRPDGEYVRAKSNGASPFSAQEYLMQLASGGTPSLPHGLHLHL